MKRFHLTNNVGKSKYVVNYHDGAKKHKDNSPFFDVAIFKNKMSLNEFIDKLVGLGYKKAR